jgi:REP element-mobilizing transposase RayT
MTSRVTFYDTQGLTQQSKNNFFHVVFALKYSRYDLERIQRKKTVGFIAPTYPMFEGKEEEILLAEICNKAIELNLNIVALNFCGDHVHCIIKNETADLSRIMRLWKGKTAYDINRRFNQSLNNQTEIKADGTKQSLWAKSYYQRILKTDSEISSTINYINLNRIKHGLPKLSNLSIEKINNLLRIKGPKNE